MSTGAHVSLALWPNQDARRLADLAVAAEDAGFNDLWWPDHYYAREFAAVLALCAARTRRIRLGTAVTSPLLRHPAILGSLFATVDELSDGRALAGLGPGGYELEVDLGVSTPSPLAATREAVAILRGLLAGEQVALPAARAFPLRGARLEFHPQHPVPIWLAARGPKMIELAGEVADGVIVHGLAAAYLHLVGERLALGAARGRRPPEACEAALMFEIALAGDRAAANNALRASCLVLVGGAYAEALIPLYGLDPAEVKIIRAAVRARDPGAARLITDTMVDAFALGGPEDYVIDRLRALAATGQRSFILSPGKRVDRRDIEALGKVVRKAFPHL